MTLNSRINKQYKKNHKKIVNQKQAKGCQNPAKNPSKKELLFYLYFLINRKLYFVSFAFPHSHRLLFLQVQCHWNKILMESKDFESFLFFFGKAVTDERRVLEKAESFYMVALGLLTLSTLKPQPHSVNFSYSFSPSNKTNLSLRL